MGSKKRDLSDNSTKEIIEKQVKKLSVLHEQTKKAQIKVTGSLDLLLNKFDELNRENVKC